MRRGRWSEPRAILDAMDERRPPRMVQRGVRESKTEFATSPRPRRPRNDRAVRVPDKRVARAGSSAELLAAWRQAPLVLDAHQVFPSRSESKRGSPQRDTPVARKIKQLVPSQDSAKTVQGRARRAKTCDRLPGPDCAVRDGEQREKLDRGPPCWGLPFGPPAPRINPHSHRRSLS
jgi:hypothetical protein